MGVTAVIPAQIVGVAARSLLVNNTSAEAACQTVSFATASTGHVLTVQSNGTVAFAAVSAGISSLNGLTDATQTFAVGTTGTDIAFVSSAGTHTLNIPSASATARGVVTTGTQRFAGIKYFDTGSIRLGTGSNDFNISFFGTDFYIDNNLGNNFYFRYAGSGNGVAFKGTLLEAIRIGLSSNPVANAADVILERDAANTLNQRRTTNAQIWRLCNTWTSSTSYEWLSIGWSSNVCTITTEKGSAGGTLRGLKIGDATTALLGFYGVTPVDQPATVADPTGGGTIDTEARTAIIAIIDRLQELGLIA